MLGNRYELLEKIGEGGMAYVYKAKCHLLNRMVAVKILRPEFVTDEEFIAKFEHESQAAASLSHHNIVNIYDVGIESEIRYIVMELVEGKTLKRYIKEKEGFVSNEEMMKIALQIAKALEHAHSNHIIHRDIKPHNIMIDKSGMVKVADFGIARAITSSTIINTTEMIGSVHYSAPEQARGGFVDERSDLYSFGILMYEMATNRLPFDGDSPVSIALKHLKEPIVMPSTINKALNKGIESVIVKSVQKDTGSRYQSAKDVIADIEKLINNPSENVPFYIQDEDSPTIILPNMAELFPEDEEVEEKPKRSKLAIFGVVIVALIISLGVFGSLTYNTIKNNLKSTVVTVPDTVNTPYEEAVQVLQGLGLYVDISEKKFDQEVPKGHIISQSVDSGTSVKEGFTISLTVSNGPITTKVPNLLQKELSEAQLILENNKLTVGEIEYVNNDLPKGYILEQSPTPGKSAAQDSAVNLVVSEGKVIETVILPSVLGKTLSEARTTLSPLNVYIGNTTYNYSDEFSNDTIMSQSKRGGSEVNEGTYINVVISKGRDPESPLPETPETPADTPADGGADQGDSTGTTTPEEEAGLIEKTYIIPLTFTTDSEVVRIELVQDGVSKMVYEKEHQKSEERIRAVVKGKGVATVNFYFGTVLMNSKVENFE
jgi:serine/threonine-protein kinase